METEDDLILKDLRNNLRADEEELKRTINDLLVVHFDLESDTSYKRLQLMSAILNMSADDILWFSENIEELTNY